MKRWYTTLATLLAVAVSAQYAAAQNLVANPGFELPTSTTTSMGNWFRFGSGGSGVSSDSTVMPRTGTGHIDLVTIGANQFAGVFQTLPVSVSPGAAVTFTGWHKAVGPDLATHEIKLEWQGSPNPPQNRVDVLNISDVYTMFTHTGVAPPGTTGLVVTYAISTFGPGQGDAQTYLDDITVTKIPEPASAGLAGLGLAALSLFRRRRA